MRTYLANDPLPYQLASMIESDLMRPGDAVDSAREAMKRLRFAKSLDAIANNLRGSANLGTPLAQLGLEAWALKNAQDSFDPLWAGSHLFLADRLEKRLQEWFLGEFGRQAAGWNSDGPRSDGCMSWLLCCSPPSVVGWSIRAARNSVSAAGRDRRSNPR